MTIGIGITLHCKRDTFNMRWFLVCSNQVQVEWNIDEKGMRTGKNLGFCQLWDVRLKIPRMAWSRLLQRNDNLSLKHKWIHSHWHAQLLTSYWTFFGTFTCDVVLWHWFSCRIGCDFCGKTWKLMWIHIFLFFCCCFFFWCGLLIWVCHACIKCVHGNSFIWNGAMITLNILY